MTSLYLIRHGQATGNVEQRFQGRSDHALTDEGRRQASLLAERFASVPLHAVFSSPLTRAVGTAEPLAESKGLRVIVEPGLTEMHFGELEDQRFDEVNEYYPDQMDRFFNQPHLYTGTGEGAESMQEVCDRMVSTTLRLLEEYADKNIAAVSHGCAIRTLLCHCFGYPLSHLYDVEPSNNTGVSHITVHENGAMMVHRVGDDSHLGADSHLLLRKQRVQR